MALGILQSSYVTVLFIFYVFLKHYNFGCGKFTETVSHMRNSAISQYKMHTAD